MASSVWATRVRVAGGGHPFEARSTAGEHAEALESIPEAPVNVAGFNYVDEVWVASDFMRQMFLQISPKPGSKFQLPVLKPKIDLALSLADLGLRNRFFFLFSFDFISALERKTSRIWLEGLEELGSACNREDHSAHETSA